MWDPNFVALRVRFDADEEFGGVQCVRVLIRGPGAMRPMVRLAGALESPSRWPPSHVSVASLAMWERARRAFRKAGVVKVEHSLNPRTTRVQSIAGRACSLKHVCAWTCCHIDGRSSARHSSQSRARKPRFQIAAMRGPAPSSNSFQVETKGPPTAAEGPADTAAPPAAVAPEASPYLPLETLPIRPKRGEVVQVV